MMMELEGDIGEGNGEEAEEQDTVVEPKKEAAVLGFFNVILPTVDVVTDLGMIVKLFRNGQPKWASLLLGPFLLNYLLSWNLWRRMEKKKTFTWILALFNCYPQYSVIKIISSFWTNPQRALAKKKTYLREASEIEVFAESVVTVLVMTFLASKGYSEGTEPGQTGALILGENYWDYENNTRHKSNDFYLFFFSYSVSILSASLGLAKSLKTGPCRTLAEGGALGGLCNGRFILLTLTMGCTLVGKGLPMAFTFGNSYSSPFPVVTSILSVALMFGPGLLLALFSMCRYRQSARDILCHPSLLLLPVFTYFTFRATRKDGHVRVSFSKYYTLANMALAVAGCVTFVGATATLNTDGPHVFKDDFYINIFVMYIPVAIASLLSSLLYLFLDCCCPCCSHSPALQESVFLPEDPLVEYVKIRVRGKKVVIPIDQM